METLPLHLLFIVLGYLLGGFPTGVVLSKGKFHIDIREMGSGNIGATNVTRVFGWWAGLLTFVVDYLKGSVPLLCIQYYFPVEHYPWLMTLTGIALVLGHCFSIYLKFKGGKGVATSLGCLTVVSVWAAGLSFATYAILVWISKISALGSLGGLFVAISYLLLVRADSATMVFILALSSIVLFRHANNIKRLYLSFLGEPDPKQNRRSKS